MFYPLRLACENIYIYYMQRSIAMNYKIVDLSAWSRGDLFRFYMDQMRIVMSLTVDIDVTPLVRFSKKNRLKFYPSMIWIVSKAVNAHDTFKYGWDAAGNLIQWETISPSYAEFHPEDACFTKLVTPYAEDLLEFHARFLQDRERYRNLRAIVKDQPANHFDVSCLPWVRYSHFDVHVFDSGKFLAPVITWGKYTAEGGRLAMPLTMNIHHAVADGFHLSRFFQEVQMLIDSLPG